MLLVSKLCSATGIETVETRWVTIETMRKNSARKHQLPAFHLAPKETLCWSTPTETRTNWSRWRSLWGRAPYSWCSPPPMTSGCMGYRPEPLASILESTSHSDVSFQLNIASVNGTNAANTLMLTGNIYRAVSDAEHSAQALLASCWSDSMC